MADMIDEMSAPQRNRDELRKALEECERKLQTARGMRKTTNKRYSDEIRDIDAEIAGILQQLSET